MQNKIVWSNDDSSVATVSMTGLVTGLQKGSCTITGKLGSDSITVHVTCDF